MPGQNKVKLGVHLAQEKDSGVRIKAVGKLSNAQIAGMKPGDMLVSMDGKALSSVDDVLELLDYKNFDDRSTFQLQRDNQTLTVEVVFKQSN